MKPRIGITLECEFDPDNPRTRGVMKLNWNYAEAVHEVGGVPILIPPMADLEELVPLLDGWLIPGGNDIDASKWGEPNHEKVELQDPARYTCEERLYHLAPPSLPIFGICYGCQFLNVVRGGSLIQHLPDVVGNELHSGGTLAPYAVQPETLLAETVGTGMVQGKSYHHQAVGELGRGLRVSATHEDGTVEAVEAVDRPWVLGVQWHPERTLDSPATQRLFRAFLAQATAFRDARLTS